MSIKTEHVGKLVRFMGCNRAAGIEQTGRITEIVNGFATVLVPVFITRAYFGAGVRAERTKTGEPWRMLLPVNDKRIVSVGE